MWSAAQLREYQQRQLRVQAALRLLAERNPKRYLPLLMAYESRVALVAQLFHPAQFERSLQALADLAAYYEAQP